MKHIINLYKWIQESTLRTFVGLIVIGLIINGVSHLANAAQTTSWDVTNNPQMYLGNSITSTQTTGITIAALTRNGSTVTFPTTSGGILRVRQGALVEDIAYDTATVDQSTKIATLAGVVRGICWNVFNSITTCSDGKAFSKGAITELSIDARLLNFKVNRDRANICTASGCLSFSGSGSFVQPYFANVTIRDTQLSTNPKKGSVSCLDSTGQCSDYLAGAWRSRSGSNVVNASLTSAGKVQIATTGAILLNTDDGSTGAPNVLPAQYTTTSGGLAGIRKVGYIPVTEDTGFLSGTLLGIGVTSTKYLRGDQTWQTIIPGSGSNLRVISVAQNGTLARTHSTAFVDIGTGAVTASLTNMSVGDLIIVTFMGSIDTPSATSTFCSFDIRVNGGRIGQLDGGANGLTNGLLTQQIGADLTDEAITLVVPHRVQTGGTLTVRPQWRSSATGEECRTGSANYPYYFYVQVIE